MVDASAETGAIDREEQSIIRMCLNLTTDRRGRSPYTVPRSRFCGLRTICRRGTKPFTRGAFTFYPVCGESKDNVIGVLNAKDYYRLDSKDRETVMAEAVRPAYLVPEGVKADVLFRNMRTTRNKFAVVLDEYGGMAGIVTITD